MHLFKDFFNYFYKNLNIKNFFYKIYVNTKKKTIEHSRTIYKVHILIPLVTTYEQTINFNKNLLILQKLVNIIHHNNYLYTSIVKYMIKKINKTVLKINSTLSKINITMPVNKCIKFFKCTVVELNFLRAARLFIKSKFSKNRANTKPIVLLTLLINVIAINELHYIYYNISINYLYLYTLIYMCILVYSINVYYRYVYLKW